MKITIWILAIALALSSFFAVYQYLCPVTVEVEKKIEVPAKITETQKQKIIDEYTTKTEKEKDQKEKLQAEKEKKEGVLYIDEKNYTLPQGTYRLYGWLFTPAGHHIAHGEGKLIQFNFLTTSIMSPCGAKLFPIKETDLTKAEKKDLLQVGTKPTETIVAQADTHTNPTTTPAPAPKPTPKPPAQKPQNPPTPPTPEPTPCGKPIQLSKGEEWTTIPGYIISGDIEFWDGNTWKPLYDNKAETALLVVIKTTGIKIRAPYGASAACDVSIEIFKSTKLAEGFKEVIIKEL